MDGGPPGAGTGLDDGNFRWRFLELGLPDERIPVFKEGQVWFREPRSVGHRPTGLTEVERHTRPRPEDTRRCLQGLVDVLGARVDRFL